MRFFLISSSLLLVLVHCNYPVAPGSYPTPPPSDSYVIPKQSYAVPPAAYATKPQYGRRFNSAPEGAGAQVATLPSAYSSDNEEPVAAPPAPPTDSSIGLAPAPPTYGGSVSSPEIAGGSALNYISESPTTAPAYRRRAKARARARARARAPTVHNRLYQRRPLQPIRRFQKKARQ
ncbi:unnamed protein product [Caenorhabditis sp. 36 PRJEB53466]|nr:unnamed protein product [Caenorhabditis sp. 36 PRJEB53466]